MSTIISTRVTPDQVQQARNADIFSLAEKHSELHKVGPNEYAGPCPKCGGEDRFHVDTAKGLFFCRKCYPFTNDNRDVIGFMRWSRGLSFVEAVEQLTGQAAAPSVLQRKPAHRKPTVTSGTFHQQHTAKLDAAIDLLANSAAGQAGRDYLLGRGLGPDVWQTFRLGYAPRVKVPDSDEYAPAIAMPWYAGDKLVAIRYRFLQVHGVHKITSERGSSTSGQLFGWQTMPEGYDLPVPDGYRPIENRCTLLVVEGEVNAMSAWATMRDNYLDVLSIGSESSRLSDAFIQFVQQYGRVLVWADKKGVAAQLMGKLPNAFAVHSPNEQDANDLHRQGLLGGFLATMRIGAASSREEAERLYWSLWDAAYYSGVDALTAAVSNDLGTRLGRRSLLVETESGSWRPEVAHAQLEP